MNAVTVDRLATMEIGGKCICVRGATGRTWLDGGHVFDQTFEDPNDRPNPHKTCYLQGTYCIPALCFLKHWTS